MNKHRLFLWPIVLLLGLGMAFSCAPPDDDDGPSKPSKPTISRVMYDFHTAELTLNGSNLPTTDLQLDKIYVGLKGTEIALKDSSGAKAEQVSITTSKHIYKITDPALDSVFEKDGKLNESGTAYNLKLEANWVMADTGSQQDTIEISVRNVTDEPGLTKVLMEKSGSDYDLTLEGYNLGTEELQLGKISVSVGTDESTLDGKVSKVGSPTSRMHSYRINDPTLKGYFDKDGGMAADNDQYELKLEANWVTTTTGAAIESIQIEVSGFSTKVNEASYNVSTDILTLEGANLASATATQEQIRTIRVDGVALDSYTSDVTASGPNSDSIVAGSYRFKNDGTTLWIKLTSVDATELEDKPGMDSDGTKAGKLGVGAGAWAGLDTAKDLMVTGNSSPSSPTPAITSATYATNTGMLVITGTNLPTAVAGWDFTKLKLTAGVDETALSEHQSSGANIATGTLPSTTSLTITLTGTEKTKADGILDNNGLRAKDGDKYNLKAEAGFIKASTSAADLTGNDINVSGYPPPANPTITSATYNVGTGELVITGTNLPSTVAGWDFTKLKFVKGDGTTESTALSGHQSSSGDTATGSNPSLTGLTITLTGTEKTKADDVLNINGDSDAIGKYNLKAEAGFVRASTSVADLAGNDITVSGNPAKVAQGSYDVSTDILTLEGTNLASATQGQIQTIRVDGIDLTSYTPDDTATGPNSDGIAAGRYRIKTDGTAIWIKLTNGNAGTLEAKGGMDSDGSKADKLDVSTGTWGGLGTAKALVVSGIPTITSATYDVVTGALVIAGTNLPSTVAGWDFTKLKFVKGDGTTDSTALSGHQSSSGDTATGSNPSLTGLTITLTGTEKTKADDVLNINGDSDAIGKYNLKAEAGFVRASTSVADLAGNDITVSGNPAKVTQGSYDVSTDILTVEGTNLASATQGQIQTIRVDGIDLTSYTADDTATGPNGDSIVAGRYRIKTDGTAIWIKLTSANAIDLEDNAGMDSNGNKADKLGVRTGTWAGLGTAKVLVVSGN